VPRIALLVLWLSLAAVVPARGLSVKVTAVNHRNGQVTLLLPMHHARIEATLMPEEPEIRLRIDGFYEAEIEAGQVDTVKRNLLKITIPGEKPARFRLRKITFLSE
jgi:hypothetical protein